MYLKHFPELGKWIRVQGFATLLATVALPNNISRVLQLELY
jgi:hypothetical protein